MREEFTENIKKHKEGLASQRAKVQEQKEEQQKMAEERQQMRVELDECMRDLKKEEGALKKLEYQTNNAKFSMMQEKAHLKAAKARQAQAIGSVGGGGGFNDDLGSGFDPMLLPVETGGTLSSMMSAGEMGEPNLTLLTLA